MPGHIDLKSPHASLQDLESRLSRGEEVVLTRDGTPVAKVVPLPAAAPDAAELARIAAQRRALFGAFAGQITIADDAFAPDPELEASFYNDDPLLSMEPDPTKE